MMVKIIRVIIVLFCVLSPCIFVTKAYAVIPQPDSLVSLSNIHVNRNLIVTGDAFFYGEYTLPYATPPEVPASQSFLFRLISSNGTTEIGSVTPYAFFDNGYNEGVFGLYFSANITWGAAYILRVSENPSQFTAPESLDFVLPSYAYTSRTTQEENQLELASNIITLARRLEEFHPSYALLDASASGTILSAPQGENYFRGAMPGIQSLAPTLFLIQVTAGDVTSTNWTTTRFDIYENRFSGTWVGTAENATAAQFSMTPQMFLGTSVILVLGVGAIIVSSRKFKMAEPGFIVCSLFLIMGALMGWFPGAVFGTIFQLFGIYTGYVWFFARS